MQKLADYQADRNRQHGCGGQRHARTRSGAPKGGNILRHGHHGHPNDPSSFGFAVWQLKEGEDKMIAERLVEIFRAAPKA